MIYSKKTFFVFLLLLVSSFPSVSFSQPEEKLLVDIVKLDPSGVSTLGNEELLYVLVSYESDIPLRFQALAMRGGAALEVGAIKNPAALHAPGQGEALAWIGYTNPTHIDSVRVTVLNEEWRELYQLTKETDVTWQGVTSANPRKPAEWVESLIRSEQRKMDFVYDASPQKNAFLKDVLFFLMLLAIPAYILLQAHMLWRYQYRWRELATIPLFPYMIMFFYYIAGLNIDTALQVTFLFRYTSLAFLYLVALWLAKRFWQGKLPPPKLYKQPKAD